VAGGRHIVELFTQGRTEFDTTEQRLACDQDDVPRGLTPDRRATTGVDIDEFVARRFGMPPVRRGLQSI
jgi:hypothetical protein